MPATLDSVELMTHQGVLDLIHSFAGQAGYVSQGNREDRFYLLELLDGTEELVLQDRLLLSTRYVPDSLVKDIYLLDDDEIYALARQSGLPTTLSRSDFLREYIKLWAKSYPRPDNRALAHRITGKKGMPFRGVH